jgi:hypothetical protein
MFKNDFIFVSPHRDDICFSLEVLAWMTGGIIVNSQAASRRPIADADPSRASRISRFGAKWTC